MDVRLIVIGMVAGLLLPLAAANAGAGFDPGRDQVGPVIDLEHGAVPTAESFGRNEDENKNKGDHDGDKDDKNHHHHHKCDQGDHSDNYDKDDHDRDCDKSPSKPHS